MPPVRHRDADEDRETYLRDVLGCGGNAKLKNPKELNSEIRRMKKLVRIAAIRVRLAPFLLVGVTAADDAAGGGDHFGGGDARLQR